MRWREVEGRVRAAVAPRTVATATVHGKCGLALGGRGVAGRSVAGRCAAGRRVHLLVDELPHGALGAVAQFAVAVHRVRVARLAEVLPQLRELVLVLVVVREAVGAEHVQRVRRVLVAGKQVVSKHVVEASRRTSLAHHTTYELLANYLQATDLARLLHLVEHIVAGHEAVGVHLHEEGAPLVVDDEVWSGLGWSGLGLG